MGGGGGWWSPLWGGGWCVGFVWVWLGGKSLLTPQGGWKIILSSRFCAGIVVGDLAWLQALQIIGPTRVIGEDTLPRSDGMAFAVHACPSSALKFHWRIP